MSAIFEIFCQFCVVEKGELGEAEEINQELDKVYVPKWSDIFKIFICCIQWSEDDCNACCVVYVPFSNVVCLSPFFFSYGFVCRIFISWFPTIVSTTIEPTQLFVFLWNFECFDFVFEYFVRYEMKHIFDLFRFFYRSNLGRKKFKYIRS